MKIKVATLLLLFCCLLGSGFASAPISKHQEKTLIGIRKNPYNPPIEVVSVKVKGKDVTPGISFLTDDKWITQVSITVRNLSGRNLIGVQASIEFPYDENDHPILPEVDLWKGQYYTSPYYDNEDFILRPGETFELQLRPNTIKGHLEDITQKSLPANVLRHVMVKPTMAVFDWDNAWFRGTYIKRDPSNPGSWIPNPQEMQKVLRLMKENFRLVKVGLKPFICYRYKDCDPTLCGAEGTSCWECISVALT